MLSNSIKKAIEESGYLLEFRIATNLTKMGYFTIPNYAFQDPDTGENKVVDIKAVGAEKITARRGEFVFPILLIECKNIKVPLVFFTFKELKLSSFLGKLHLSGIPKKIKAKTGQEKDLLDYLNIEKFHHYYKTGKLSSHFCGVIHKGNEYIPTHDLEGRTGNLYQTAIFPLIKAVHHDKQIYEKSLRPNVIDLQFYYPIFVVPGPIYECSFENAKPKYKKTEVVNFMVRYESAKMETAYLIDVVTEKKFPDLLVDIESENKKMSNLIKKRRDDLIKNVSRITQEKNYFSEKINFN